MSVSIFKIDRKALDEAREYLGITWDARVTISGTIGAAGRYSTVHEHIHKITLNAYLSLCDAEFVVWHELTHALQSEAVGGGLAHQREWMRQLHEQGLTLSGICRGMSPADAAAYDRMPYEAEANHMAEDRPKLIRVTVPR